MNPIVISLITNLVTSAVAGATLIAHGDVIAISRPLSYLKPTPSGYIEAAGQVTFSSLPSGWEMVPTVINPQTGDLTDDGKWYWVVFGQYDRMKVVGQNKPGTHSKNITLSPKLQAPANASGNVTVNLLASGFADPSSQSASSSVTALTETASGSCGTDDGYSNPNNKTWLIGVGPDGIFTVTTVVNASGAI